MSAPNASVPPVQTEPYEEHVSFEPPPQQPSAPANNQQQDEYYSYGSINLEPMDPQQAPSAAPKQEQYPAEGYNQQPAQQGDYNVTGKTDLDMEIERYQREIEEKQKRMRTGGGAPQQAAPPPGLAPQQPQQPQMPPPQQKAPAADSVQNDYDVYNMDMRSYSAPQPRAQQQQPMIGGNEDEEMFFTSVDTDRQKKPVRRPVNPRTQQQKGFLSKFFNKDMP
jgi:hypothetical protein